MASEPVLRTFCTGIDIPPQLRESLRLRETDAEYSIRTLSGKVITRSKSDIRYPWQLLSGILDDQKDTTDERRRDREYELSHDERKLRSGAVE